MANKRPQARAIELEFSFDRLLPAKLAQAYQLLVPDKAWVTGDERWAGENPPHLGVFPRGNNAIFVPAASRRLGGSKDI